MARIPQQFDLANIQASFRDVWEKVDAFLKDEVDFGKRRKVTHAIDGTHPEDYITLAQLQRAIASINVSSSIVAPNSAPGCRVYNSAAINLANDAEVLMTFNSERYDSGEMHSTSSNTSRITCVIPGIYAIGASVQISNTDADNMWAFGALRLNGTTRIAEVANTNNGFNARINPNTIYKLAASDYVEVLVRQNNTDADTETAVSTGHASPEFWAQWLAPSP